MLNCNRVPNSQTQESRCCWKVAETTEGLVDMSLIYFQTESERHVP